MTLSNQLGALGRSGAGTGTGGSEEAARKRTRKTVTVVPPDIPAGGDAAAPAPFTRKVSIRKKLSNLIKQGTDELNGLLDETATGLVRTLSMRRKFTSRRKKISSEWSKYSAGSFDEESAWYDGEDSGPPSATGSMYSLNEEALSGHRFMAPPPAALRRTHSFIEPTRISDAETPPPSRPRAMSHAGLMGGSGTLPEFRRSIGCIPSACGAAGPQPQRRHGRASMHSAWSSSLSSLQEGVIANDLHGSGSAGTLMHNSEESLPPYAEGDEVDSAELAEDCSTPLTGLHGPTWAFLCSTACGSLPSGLHQLHQPSSLRAVLARSWSSSAGEKRPRSSSSSSSARPGARPRCAACARAPPPHSSVRDEPTRSRSLTHLAALDMSGDPARPDRLVVPPAADAPSLRRQKLTTRSQLSSSEYFCVIFDVGAESGAAGRVEEEYIVATKGTTLEEALNGACQKRGLDISNLSVFLEGCKVPLSATHLHTETSLLAGKQLTIRAKEDGKTTKGVLLRAATSQQPTLRKSSGSVRSKSGRFFSTSTEDPSFSNIAGQQASDFLGLELAKSKGSKQRWSGFFGNNKDTMKMEALSEQLDKYTKHGIPREHQSSPDPEMNEKSYLLEDNWRQIVDGAEALPDRMQQQQDAIWELLHTELAYIRTLTVVTDLFLACLTSLQEAQILKDVDKARLFSNITEIHSANAHFWALHLLPLLNVTRETRQPLNPQLLLDGFLKFDELFRPYEQYCAEQAECQKYCRDRTQDSELFTAYLAWCETQGACNRLRLMDILVKPMQRLTKYSLLLKAILKKTDCEEQRVGLEMMIRRVDDFVNSINSKLRERQDYDKLRAIIARIDAYDIVESKDEDLERMVRQHSELDLTRPMPSCAPTPRRHLMLEGDLRLKDHNTSKIDVHCFLLTDMLLVCKTTTKKTESRTARVRVLRPPYLVERLVVQELQRDPPTLACVYLNEYQVATSAFLLSSPEAKLIKNWADMIRKAQGLYAQAKQAAAAILAGTTVLGHPPPLSLSRQPSSFYEEDMLAVTDISHNEDHEAECQSYASYSQGLYPQHRSPRGSTRASSLNHSHSGSVEMNEASSLSSVSHSRGVSVDNNELRGSSLSSDEGIPPLGSDQGGAPGTLGGGRGAHRDRKSMHSKSPSPNTLSIQVPVFSSLGQSLPNLNLAASSPHSGLQPPSSLLLVPPTGKGGGQHHGGPLSPGHRGTSYPPPSPPRGSLHRGMALVASRNPPLLKMRHVSSVGVSCSGSIGPGSGAGPQSPTGQTASTFDFDVPVIAGVSPPRDDAGIKQQQANEQQQHQRSPSTSSPPPPSSSSQEPLSPSSQPPQQSTQQQRQTFMMKRLARTENRRYHTAGAIDDVKKAEVRDASIQKRLSWNYGPQSCAKRQPTVAQDESQDLLQQVQFIDRATSPLGPPPQNLTDSTWSYVLSGSMERNPFADPALFQSPSLGSSPSQPGLPGSSPGPSPAPSCSPSNPFLEAVVSQDDMEAPLLPESEPPPPLPPDQGLNLIYVIDAQSDQTDA